MSLPLYFDHHVPGAVAAALRQRGVDVLTAQQDGRKELVDELLLTRATSLGRILVTNDRGFHTIVARWRREARHFAGLAYYGDQHIPLGKLVDDLMLISAVYGADEMMDRIEYLSL
ncbi:MAG: DUF5615 family PIN-like protein [Dehalococcoidia bacterium]